MNTKIKFEDLGLMDYQSAWDYQTSKQTADRTAGNTQLPPLRRASSCIYSREIRRRTPYADRREETQ